MSSRRRRCLRQWPHRHGVHPSNNLQGLELGATRGLLFLAIVVHERAWLLDGVQEVLAHAVAPKVDGLGLLFGHRATHLLAVVLQVLGSLVVATSFLPGYLQRPGRFEQVAARRLQTRGADVRGLEIFGHASRRLRHAVVVYISRPAHLPLRARRFVTALALLERARPLKAVGADVGEVRQVGDILTLIESGAEVVVEGGPAVLPRHLLPSACLWLVRLEQLADVIEHTDLHLLDLRLEPHFFGARRGDVLAAGHDESAPHRPQPRRLVVYPAWRRRHEGQQAPQRPAEGQAARWVRHRFVTRRAS